ncbi:GIY-YIG nuclease family protein [Vibrio owensii]|uniref:GIY-YIG nuclease family protein n=1 Tax=Vibrio owensii TaxID=696485 RepID=UPI002FF1CE39
MAEKLNFSTQFYPQVNALRSWIKDSFYPYLKKLNGRKDTFRLYNLNRSQNTGFNVIKNKSDVFSFEQLLIELSHFNKKAGIYGIVIKNGGMTAFAYVGKSKQLDIRVREHLTGKNKNGSALKPSVSTKHSNINELVQNGNFEVSLFVWTNQKLTNSPNLDYELGVLESLVISESQNDFDYLMAKLGLEIRHLNYRNG